MAQLLFSTCAAHSSANSAAKAHSLIRQPRMPCLPAASAHRQWPCPRPVAHAPQRRSWAPGLRCWWFQARELHVKPGDPAEKRRPSFKWKCARLAAGFAINEASGISTSQNWHPIQRELAVAADGQGSTSPERVRLVLTLPDTYGGSEACKKGGNRSIAALCGGGTAPAVSLPHIGAAMHAKQTPQPDEVCP